MNKQKTDKKLGLVVGVNPEDYKIFDSRLNKPTCFKNVQGGFETASMILQEVDEIKIGKSRVTYFTPNNVAILLSISSKALESAQSLFDERLNPKKTNLDMEKAKDDKRKILDEISTDVCDYIETVQTCIIFGYTAVETFANLSIPADYVHSVNNKNKGTTELHDKKAIERWITLKDKIIRVLPSAYDTKSPKGNKFWSQFSTLETYRQEIIHQKSIKSTDFYKRYFQRDIFDICSSPKKVINYFYSKQAEVNKTNPLWPWLDDNQGILPLSYDFDQLNLEVIGNIYEGFKKTPVNRR